MGVATERANVVLPHWRGPCNNTTGVSVRLVCKAFSTKRGKASEVGESGKVNIG